jgi:hypothetical protein
MLFMHKQSLNYFVVHIKSNIENEHTLLSVPRVYDTVCA